MSNETMKQILESHKAWLCDQGGERADLREADLQRADLQRANLQRANLQAACLREADLQRADLQRANLQKADLREADLQKANLRAADLRAADLRGADLRAADLREADFRGADFRGAVMSPGLVWRMDFGGYSVCITPEMTSIGCQSHPSTVWLEWEPKNVAGFAQNAETFWKDFGPAIKACIRTCLAQANKQGQERL